MNVEGPNVLISSAGRRVGLVRAFQDAVGPLGGRVITTDNRPELSAACQLSDIHAQVPRIEDPGFLDATLSIAQSREVGLVIPTLDTELAELASVRSEWSAQGIHVSVPDAELTARCRDKRQTADLFDSLGISPLQEVTDQFPRFIKPISGSLSQDIHLAHSPRELQPRLEDRTRFVHQELVDTNVYTEYTVDALYSHSGDLVCAVPRRRIEVRGGEISKGRTEKGPLLEAIRARLARIPGARGCLTIQVFYAETVERPLIGIEVNARFGGGYPMSHEAGATFTHWLVDETLAGRPLQYRDDWRDGLTFLRFDDQVVVGA